MDKELLKEFTDWMIEKNVINFFGSDDMIDCFLKGREKVMKVNDVVIAGYRVEKRFETGGTWSTTLVGGIIRTVMNNDISVEWNKGEFKTMKAHELILIDPPHDIQFYAGFSENIGLLVTKEDNDFSPLPIIDPKINLPLFIKYVAQRGYNHFSSYPPAIQEYAEHMYFFMMRHGKLWSGYGTAWGCSSDYEGQREVYQQRLDARNEQKEQRKKNDL